MSERALFVNIDSIKPNLTFMKLSTYFMSRGGYSGFNMIEPDKIFISCILDKNRHKAYSSMAMLRMMYPRAEIDIGGTGINLYKSIPEIELLYPNYRLYPSIDYSYGFTTRGCDRNCGFCVVPKKEGRFKIVQHPKEFHSPFFRKIVLMDNNILFDKDWFFEVTDWILEMGLAVDFNQGLDIRLMDQDVADRLKELKPMSNWHFAFDDIKYLHEVVNGISMLKDAGIDTRHFTNFLLYVDKDEDYDDAVERCRILKAEGCGAYAMININTERTRRLKNLYRWTTRKQLFFSIDIDEYALGMGGKK